jgi:RNA polymerase sigma factor (sigma-70 family)
MGLPRASSIDEDVVLLRRWVGGDQLAARQLILRHERELSRLFRVEEPADADDLMQETLLAVMEARDRFRGEASFRTYLLRVARYKLWSHRRRRHGWRSVSKDDIDDELLYSYSTDQTSSTEQPLPVDGLEEALERLPPALSRVITLSFQEQLTRDAIASELGIPPGTVASRIRTAKARLRAFLVAKYA